VFEEAFLAVEGTLSVLRLHLSDYLRLNPAAAIVFERVAVSLDLAASRLSFLMNYSRIMKKSVRLEVDRCLTSVKISNNERCCFPRVASLCRFVSSPFLSSSAAAKPAIEFVN